MISAGRSHLAGSCLETRSFKIVRMRIVLSGLTEPHRISKRKDFCRRHHIQFEFAVGVGGTRVALQAPGLVDDAQLRAPGRMKNPMLGTVELVPCWMVVLGTESGQSWTGSAAFVGWMLPVGEKSLNTFHRDRPNIRPAVRSVGRFTMAKSPSNRFRHKTC